MALPLTALQIAKGFEKLPKLPIELGQNRIGTARPWELRDNLSASLALLVSGGASQAEIANLQTQLTALANRPPIKAKNLVYLSKNADDPYQGSLQKAIDACESPAPDNRWEVKVLSPGSYDPAILPQYVYLNADGSGVLGGPFVINGQSGDTLQVPDVDAGVTGFQVNTNSPNANDRAVRLVSGVVTPESRQFQCDGCSLTSTAAGYPLGSNPGTLGAPCVMLNTELQTGTAAWLAKMEGTGLALFNGALNQFGTGGGLWATTGSFNILIVAVMNGNADWLMKADGATVVGVDLKVFNALKLAQAINGGTTGIGSLFSIASLTNLLDLDAASFGFLGDIQLLQNASPYSLITSVVPGNVQFCSTLDYSEGTTIGPNQRPATPRLGSRFYATNLIPPVVLTYTSAGWVDPAGAIIP